VIRSFFAHTARSSPAYARQVLFFPPDSSGDPIRSNSFVSQPIFGIKKLGAG